MITFMNFFNRGMISLQWRQLYTHWSAESHKNKENTIYISFFVLNFRVASIVPLVARWPDIPWLATWWLLGLVRKVQSCTAFSGKIAQHRDLTHWGLKNMVDILQITFSKAFLWMKSFAACLKFCSKFLPDGPINSSPPSATYIRHWTGSALVQIMACHLFGAKPLSKPVLGYCQLDP